MRAIVLLMCACFGASVACGKTDEHPEVAFRHCMLEQAREVGTPNYEQAVQFSRNCEDLAVSAATLRTREELGNRFDPASSATVDRIRENQRAVVDAHVCAIAFDPKHCPYLPD